MVYQWCVVPQCTNKSTKTPEKLFISVPKKAKIRKKWLQLARRDPNDIVVTSSVYFCEDHFDTKMRSSRINKIIKIATEDTMGKTPPTKSEIVEEDFVPSIQGPSKPQEYDKDIADFVSYLENSADEWLLCKEPLIDFVDSDDSVIDKDYLLRESDESSHSSVIEDKVKMTPVSKSRKRKNKKHKHTKKQKKTTEIETQRNTESNTNLTITAVAQKHLPTAEISEKSEEDKENSTQKMLNDNELSTEMIMVVTDVVVVDVDVG